MRSRRGATELAGVLPVDKPAGLTSHDVVNAMRAATGERRIGHAGTLDPMATGLLLVLVGRATRLEPYLVGHDKTYEARISFGSGTDTLDATGTVIAEAPVPDWLFDPAWAAQVLAGFLGRQEQMPPAYSAIKCGGVAAHRLARAGKSPDLEPRPIIVHRAELETIDAAGRTWDVTFEVSKGTYIRSLARDIGLSVGTIAHLSALRRTRVGLTDVATAVSFSDAEAAAAAGDLASLMPDPVPFLEMPATEVDPTAIADGRSIPVGDRRVEDNALVALVTDSELLGLYRRRGPVLVPETVLVPGVSR